MNEDKFEDWETLEERTEGLSEKYENESCIVGGEDKIDNYLLSLNDRMEPQSFIHVVSENGRDDEFEMQYKIYSYYVGDIVVRELQIIPPYDDITYEFTVYHEGLADNVFESRVYDLLHDMTDFKIKDYAPPF